MKLDKDLHELLELFFSKGVEFLVVGDRVSARLDATTVWMIGRDDLIRNRRATGRTQDIADAEFLEKLAG